jgi:hypothetical protein
MSCHGEILNFISALPSGAWFATQQVLNLGTREAIDQCLYRLVKCGYLTRIAWGLFTLRTTEQTFEPLAVAKFKARNIPKESCYSRPRYSKATWPRCCCYRSAQHYTACTVSAAHSNQSKREISLKSYSPRKIALGDSANR